MSDNVETLGIRLNAEGVPEFTNGMKLAGDTTEGMGKKAEGASKGLSSNTEQMARSGKTARETAAAWRLLPAQMTDIVTSLASGQPAWLVAIQQGGQIKDSFGGVGPMFEELSGKLTMGRLALGGVALGGAAVVGAFVQATRETHAFNQALTLTNNAAGTNAREMADMAARVAEVVGTQGKAADALASLAATGEVGRANLQAFSSTAINMERELDAPLASAAAKFEALGRAPLEASLRLNQGLNYLTAATYDHIRSLQAQGRWTEAATVAQQAYATAMDQRTRKLREDLTIVEILWRKAGDSAKGAWDAFVDNLRPSTWDRKMEEVKGSLTLMQQFWNLVQGGGAGAQNAWAGLSNAAPKDTSAEDAAEVARRKQELRDRERANVEASIAVEMAQATSAAAQRQAVAELDLARARAIATARESQLRAHLAALEDLRQRDGVSLADYHGRRAELDRQALAGEIATVDAEIRAEQRRTAARGRLIDEQIAAERKRQAENPAEAAQQQARLIELAGQRQALALDGETRLAELQARRARLTADQAAAGVAAERAVMLASADATERWLDDVERRRQALAQLNDQQRQANAAAAADLIADPYARAAARARLDIEQLNDFYAEQLSGLRARLPGLETSDPDQAAAVREQILQAERQKNDAIVLRTRQLTEELKPEWQKQLEAWQDHTRMMRESFDEFQSGWLSSGRAAWAEYMRSGKLSLDSLGQFARQQLGDMVFKQVIAQPLARAGDAVARLLGMGGLDGAAAATGVATETAARSLNTTAVTANSTAMGNLALAATSAAAALAQVAAAGGGNSAVGLLGQILGAVAGGDSAFSAVDGSGYGMTSGGVSLPTRGGLASGGPARAGSLYEVNERGPELLTVNNRTYLMMGGKDGFVTPNTPGAVGGGGRGGNSVVLAPNIYIDSRSDRAQIATLVQNAMRSAQVELLDMMARRQA
ncbi:MAG: phage tail length tape measure family protein [Roseateles sp.]